MHTYIHIYLCVYIFMHVCVHLICLFMAQSNFLWVWRSLHYLSGFFFSFSFDVWQLLFSLYLHEKIWSRRWSWSHLGPASLTPLSKLLNLLLRLFWAFLHENVGQCQHGVTALGCLGSSACMRVCICVVSITYVHGKARPSGAGNAINSNANATPIDLCVSVVMRQ